MQALRRDDSLRVPWQDTIVYEASGPRTLSTIPHQIIAVSC